MPSPRRSCHGDRAVETERERPGGQKEIHGVELRNLRGRAGKVSGRRDVVTCVWCCRALCWGWRYGLGRSPWRSLESIIGGAGLIHVGKSEMWI